MKSRPLALPLLWSFYASFLVIGLLMGLTGPLLPYLRADLNLGYAEAGLMFSAQSVGGLVVLVLGGWLVHRFGTKALLVAGAGSFAAGLLASAGASAFPALLAGQVLLGAGMSLLDISISTVVIEAHAEGKGKALGRLHFFFGAGAVIGPMIALAVAHLDGGWRWAFGITALGPAVVAVLAAFLRFPPSAESTVAQKVAVYRKPYLWWGAVALFVYCGVEWGVGAWFPSYWKAIPGTAAFDPAWATSLFWLTFAVGRLLQGPWADRWGFERFLTGSIVATLAVVVLWLVFPQPAAALVWVLIFGFLIAGQYPTFVALISHRYPAASGQVTSFLSIFASLGTFAWPPGVGALADAQGIAVLPWAQLAMTLLLLTVALATFALGRKPHA